MQLSLRTTIFWNIVLLMTLAIALISLVVLRVTEREIVKQRTLAGEMIFTAIEATIGPGSSDAPQTPGSVAGAPALQELFGRFVRSGMCSRLMLVNSRNKIINHSMPDRIGRYAADMDIQQAMGSQKMYKKIYRRRAPSGPELVIAGPVKAQGKRIGFLKAVFPLEDVQQSISQAERTILIYILFDGVVLIFFGTFLLTRYVAKPIKKLIRITENIAEGNLDATSLYLSDRNEIGKLSLALHQMSDKLQDEKEVIHKQVRDLEEKNIQLQQAQREIMQSEKLASIGRLAAGIAHEIGNPAGIILGYIHMLRDSDLDETTRADYLNKLEAEADRVNSIIRDLLDYAQPSSRDAHEIDLNAVIVDTFGLLSYQKECKNITPLFRLADSLPPLYANEKQVRQLVMNLMLNSIDAMPDGGTLSCTTALSTGEEIDTLCFIVEDTGTGISPENLEKIFDPFFTTKEQGKGTGLGLSNVHRIVELLDGTIEFSSDPGRQTVVTLKFPVTKRQTAHDKQ